MKPSCRIVVTRSHKIQSSFENAQTAPVVIRVAEQAALPVQFTIAHRECDTIADRALRFISFLKIRPYFLILPAVVDEATAS